MDVDTSTSNVGGHQDVFGSGLEVGERELSLLLTFAAVQRASVVLRGEEEDHRGYVSFRMTGTAAHGDFKCVLENICFF